MKLQKPTKIIFTNIKFVNFKQRLIGFYKFVCKYVGLSFRLQTSSLIEIRLGLLHGPLKTGGLKNNTGICDEHILLPP